MSDPFTLSPATAAFVQEIQQKKYMQKGEVAWADTLTRVTRSFFPNCDEAEHQDATDARLFLELLSKKIITPAGRILAGAGTDRNVTMFNCFISPLLQDSMRTDPTKPGKGIMDALADVAYSMQMGGGVGTDFSPLRPQGALVHRLMASASGPLAFMDMWDAMCRTVMSAGDRRGAMMATLMCDHPDIMAFIAAKHDPRRLRMFNVSVLVTDAFMAAVAQDQDWQLGHWEPPFEKPAVDVITRHDPYTKTDRQWYVYEIVRARAIWDAIMRSTYDHAEPGVIFIDRVNQMNNLRYYEHIQATNPCFTGDTLVWTSHGAKPIATLVGQEPLVLSLNASGRFVYRKMANIRCTQRNASLIEITIHRPQGRDKPWVASKIRCTPNHIFYLKSGEEIQAKDLVKGMRLSSVTRALRGTGGVYLGLYNHTGSMMEHHVPFEDLVGAGIDVDIHHINEQKHDNRPENLERRDHALHSSEHKKGDRNPMRRHPEKNHFRTRDNKGQNNGRYRHDIDTSYLQEMRDTGLSYAAIAKVANCSVFTAMKRLGWTPPRNHTVVSVKRVLGREDVYCGEVEETHRFFIQTEDNGGVLVHNCGEQAMAPDNACNLWHVNLSRCVTGTPFTDDCEINYEMIRQATRMLVRAGDRLIDLSRYPTQAQEQASKDRRRIGIGITGLANLFMFKRERYGSAVARRMADQVMRAICLEAYRESCRLAKELGPFPAYNTTGFLDSTFVRDRLPDSLKTEIRKHGIRNALLLSVAPTGTTSIGQCDNCSGGLEPVFALRYNRKVLERDDSFSLHSIEDLGFRVFANIFHDGDADAAYEDTKTKDYMATAESLSPIDHLHIQAAIQKWTDNSVSKTINVATNTPFEAFKEIYSQAYELQCKGCTTYRDNPDSGRGAVLTVDKPEIEQVEDAPTPAAQEAAELCHELGHLAAAIDENGNRKRPDILEGRTYRLRWSQLPYPMFVTINDEIRPDGTRVPFEVFINSKAVEHAHWVSALTRMISAVMRKGGDLTFIPDELKQVWSARGGEFIDQKFVPSEVALIGLTLERHFREIGYLKGIEPDIEPDTGPTPPGAIYAEAGIGEQCPTCGALQVIREQGCKRCIACGWSNCG